MTPRQDLNACLLEVGSNLGLYLLTGSVSGCPGAYVLIRELIATKRRIESASVNV
jgi:ribosomal protein L3